MARTFGRIGAENAFVAFCEQAPTKLSIKAGFGKMIDFFEVVRPAGVVSREVV